MNINRYNYEEYFLLYTDNELNAEERAAVENFAAEHPDLGEELVLLQQSVIRPEKHLVFTNKEALMKTSLAQQGINDSNYEGYFILYLDDELNAPEKAAVETYLYKHPELETVFEKFQHAKLQPEKILFPAKETLYRQEERKRVVAMHWWRMAAAAVVILFAGWFWINQADKPSTPPQLAGQNGKAVTNEDVSSRNSSNKPTNKEEHAADASGKIIPGATAENNSTKKQAGENVLTAKPKSTNLVATASLKSNIRKELKKEKAAGKVGAAEEEKNLAARPVTGEPKKHEQTAMVVTKLNGSIKTLPLMQQAAAEEIPEDNISTIAFAADRQSENVFLTNIPVDGNLPGRGLLRKASRVINKVAALKNGIRPGISIGNVEIAIQ